MLGADAAVVVESARIFFVVFVRAELGRVDEDGNDEHVGARARFVHQGRVSRVQVAHGRDERDRFALRTERERGSLKFVGVVNDFHRVKEINERRA